MENREYFFHKRKSMTKEIGQFDDDMAPFDSSSYLNDGGRAQSQRSKRSSSDRFFYDRMGTSCNLEDRDESEQTQNQGKSSNA